ncbi:MAG TPA: hypothetical protein ENN39_10625 [Desulfonatronum sp.]|nr:hypothetical protein [Desulfonatronum sp.]
MFQAWIHSKRHEFVRDILRDFCTVQQLLERQFLVFDREERVDFEVLRDILGVEMNKGLLWRLKDTSHHLFRSKSSSIFYGQLLDWCLGYIFHETMKLKEDAYQQHSYGERFRCISDEVRGAFGRQLLQELGAVVAQTRESMRREITRIRFIMAACCRLFLEYLPRHKDNTLLARFLYDRNALVRKVFARDYDALINVLYGDHPERMFLLAAQSLDLGGWEREAAMARQKARDIARSA